MWLKYGFTCHASQSLNMFLICLAVPWTKCKSIMKYGYLSFWKPLRQFALPPGDGTIIESADIMNEEHVDDEYGAVLESC
jgi:hypothetical protein